MLLDLFIKAGWYTVPLGGKLERLSNGDKTLPMFEEKWREKYTTNFNEKIVPLAGVITGAKSGIIAIDCDNKLTYDMFRGLDPDYAFHFISKGKPSGGGTIIYKYSDKVGGFKLSTETIKLDFYSDEGFVYLPTEHNHTKEPWDDFESLPHLNECPETILAILTTFKARIAPTGVTKNVEIKHTISNRLAPMLDTFVKAKKYEPVLFKVITPYSFRDLPTYITKGHLHPNDVPQGRGSEYLSKISAILGSDISVSIELYTNAMMIINSLWDTPMEKTKLMSTIINPMIEERSTGADGSVIWRYDPHWEKMGFIATTINGDYIESFYDDVKGMYYLINYTIPYIRVFHDKRPIITTLRTLLGRTISDQQYDGTKQLIRTILNPSMEFGHIEGTDRYNLFRQTPELAIINNPGAYHSQYVRPTTIIRYFESLIPDDYMRTYVLSFLKTKLTTFKYSPVVLYFIGKPGSGKDTFVNILRTILGADYVAKPDSKVFLEQYNGWLIDKYLIQLDEYGNKLVRQSDKQEALGRIKAYTGSAEIQIRAMRTDGFNYRHSATFMLTANSNPLPVEAEDRRFAFIKTPNKLAQEQWVADLGGISHVVEKLIPSEIQHFCYYLATEIPSLGSDAYVSAPDTDDKELMILNSLPAVDQIAFYMQNNKYSDLVNLAEEYAVVDFCKDWDRGRLLDDKLEELYSAMTEGNGVHRTLIRKLKEIGISRQHTTKNNQNQFYYYLSDLHRHKPKDYKDSSEIQPFSSGIKGLT